jgi:hypothetical protein
MEGLFLTTSCLELPENNSKHVYTSGVETFVLQKISKEK